MIEMTYEKANGQIIRRIRNTYPDYKIGDRTSMGWKVVDIRYLYKKKYYHKCEYDKKVDTHVNKIKKIYKIKRIIQSLYKQTVYVVEMIIVIRFLGILARNF